MSSATTNGLVTVCMPVMDGELFLPYALDALLTQTYREFEIVILDDLSTDRTPDICQAYARQDSRVRYIRDDQHRITHDAANKLATHIRGEYCMLACDDDLWEPRYLEVLTGLLAANPEVGLAYSNADLVNLEGVCSGRPVLRANKLFQAQDQPVANFTRYLSHRQVIPLVFGLFRTESYLATLPWDTFDETIADVDNLFMLKFFSRFRAHSVDEILFHYRSKYRWSDPDILQGFPKTGNPVAVWLYQLAHERRFLGKTFGVIRDADFSSAQKRALEAYAALMLAHFMTSKRAIARFKDLRYHALVRLGLREQLHAPASDVTATLRHVALLTRSGSAEQDQP